MRDQASGNPAFRGVSVSISVH